MYGVILALKISITILLAVIVIIIMLLVIPYTYAIDGNIRRKFNKGKFQISWFWGLLRCSCVKVSDKFDIKIYFIRLCIYDNFKKNKPINNTDIKINVNSKFGIVNFKKIDLKILKEIYQYLKDIISILQPNSFKIYGVYGLEDPFFTGSISAVVSILKSNFKGLEIEVSPVFDDVILDISLDIKGNTNLLSIAFRTIKLLLNRDIRKFILKKA